MRFGTGKALGALAPVLLMLAVLAPSAGAALSTSIERVQAYGATSAVPSTTLTINDLRGVDNRIAAFIAPSGRLTLIAPEGLGDPDGPTGTNCTLDNPQGAAVMATQISCAPNYVQVIVGDLNGGNDSFSASPDLPLGVGSVLGGLRSPMSGGIGEDRIVGGAVGDLLDGGTGDDSVLGNPGEDLLTGGAGKDRVIGGGARDAVYGGGGADKLNGGPARDFCSGGAGLDLGVSCNIFQSIP